MKRTTTHDAPKRRTTARPVSRLKSLAEVASVVNAGGDLAAVLERAVVAVCQHTRWDTSSVMAVDRAQGRSVLVAHFDPYRPVGKRLPTSWALSTSPTLRVVKTNRPVVIADAQHSRSFPGYRADALARGYRSAVLVPVRAEDAQGRPLVLAVHARTPFEVDAEELTFLEAAAQLAAIAVEKARGIAGERARTERLQSSVEAQGELMRLALGEGGLGPVFERAQSLLSEPAALIDLASGSVRAGRSPATDRMDDAQWSREMAGTGGRALLEAVRTALAEGAADLKVELALGGHPLRLMARLYPLVIDGASAGALAVFPRGGDSDPLAALEAAQAAFALSVRLMRQHVRFESENLSRADLLAQLFEGTWRDREETIARAGRLGLDLTGPARLVALAWPPTTDGAGVSQASAFRAVSRAAAEVFPRAAAAPDGAGAVLFVPGADDPGERGWRASLDRLIEAVRWSAGDGVAIATGEPCRRLEDYARARAELARTLALARTFGRAGLVSAADFGPFAALLSSGDRGAIAAFVARTLDAIEAHDRDHRGDLLATAKAFIDAGCRYQAAADALGVHVTTLRYRLERVTALFGLDFDDADRRFALDLALRLRQAIRT